MHAIFTPAGTALGSAPQAPGGGVRGGRRPGVLRTVFDRGRADPEPGRGSGCGGGPRGRELGRRWGWPVLRCPVIRRLVRRRDRVVTRGWGLVRLVQPVSGPGHRGLPGSRLPGLVRPHGDLKLTDRPAGEPVPGGAAPQRQRRHSNECAQETAGEREQCAEQERESEDAQRQPSTLVTLEHVDAQHRGRRPQHRDYREPHTQHSIRSATLRPASLARAGEESISENSARVSTESRLVEPVEDREHQEDRPSDHEPGRHGQLPGTCGGGLATRRATRRVTHGVIEPTAPADPLIRR